MTNIALVRPGLLVFYNTKCPVCNVGVTGWKLQLVDAVKAGVIEFRDINEEPDALISYGARIDDVRRRLHALDKNAVLIKGVDVALAVWRLTESRRWLASLLGNRLVLPIARFGYDRFADLLFAWNKRNGRF